jgi:hypothetical protein
MQALGFVSQQHRSGLVINRISCYEWRWILTKDTVHGAETIRRTMAVSFGQSTLSTSEAPVTISWVSERFQQGQLSWDSWSGQVSKPFSSVEHEGFGKLLKEASAHAESVLHSKKDMLEQA